MIGVKDACIQGFPSTHRRDEQDICIAAGNTGNIKRKKILVDIEACNSLKKELVDQKKNNLLLQSSGNLWKAECKRLMKMLSDTLTNSKCHRLSSTQDTLRTSASETFKLSNLLRNRKKYCDRELLRTEILEAEIPMSLSRPMFTYFDECLC